MEEMSFSLSFIFLCIYISLSFSFAFSLQYQTLLLQPLPHPNSISSISNQEHDSNPFSLPLHHLDFLTPNTTPENLFKLRLQRDATRVKNILNLISLRTNSSVGSHSSVTTNSSVGGYSSVTTNAASSAGKSITSTVVSGLSQGSGEYFTRLGIGTPAKYSYMVLDTGSDVVWVQCSPCKQCYNQSDPVFNPKKSTSFNTIKCDSLLCRSLDSPGCNSRRNSCLYQVSYGDGSFTVGEFSTETLTFRRTRVSNIALGCGHDNEGLFTGAAGLLGLGRGRLGFPVQAGKKFGRKFSYCLVDRSASGGKPSSLIFGDDAIGRNSVFTPLLTNARLDTFYYLGLEGFSVGGVRVEGVTSSVFEVDGSGKGGVIIDSGTSVTRLARPAYVALRDAFRVGASSLKVAKEFSLFDTCFDLSGKTEVKVPTVVLHFAKANVSLPASNYLIPVDSSGKFCFAFAGTSSGLSIIGNIQQQGFRVAFNLAGSRVGFAPHGCG